MKTTRRCPGMRAAAWLVSLTLVVPVFLFGRNVANAQTQQVLRVIVADFVNKKGALGDPLAVTARDAVYNELASSGQGRFSVFTAKEVIDDAVGEKIIPAPPASSVEPIHFGLSDLLRIAKSLNADAIVEGEVEAAPSESGARSASVAISITLRDVASEEYTNGAAARVRSVARPGQSASREDLINRATGDAAMEVVRQVVSRQIVTATVLNINQDVVILNRGLRDGLHVGDELIVLREGTNGRMTQEGRIRIARSYSADAEATVLSDPGGIRPEDIARILYRPRAAVTPLGDIRPISHRSGFSASMLGLTLGVIGLGILVAAVGRGGQSSVTGVTAEAASNANAPLVKITWRDNLFGQSGVQQYHVYRDPGFPFGSTVPAGVTAGTTHNYIDHASPFNPYAGGLQVQNGLPSTIVGVGNSTCTLTTPGVALDFGFQVGQAYRYSISAIIIRATNPASGGGNNGGGGGNNGGGQGQECIETDPSTSGQTTPILPTSITSPAPQTNVKIRGFNVTFPSQKGADLFQVEVSTDRSFSNPSRIYRVQVASTAPNAIGVPQSLPSAVDLSTQGNLTSDPAFQAVASNTGPITGPPLYIRVGARNDSDNPGPIHWITHNPGDGDRSFRYVYSDPIVVTSLGGPPDAPNGKASVIAMNRGTAPGRRTAALPLPLPGQTNIPVTRTPSYRPVIIASPHMLNGRRFRP